MLLPKRINLIRSSSLEKEWTLPVRLLVRRVNSASVNVAGEVVGKINQGLAVYIGIEDNDEISDLEWGAKK